MREKRLSWKKTKRLGLILPNEDDAYNISGFNENFRIIDEKGGSTEELNKLLTEDKTCLVNAINEVFQNFTLIYTIIY